MQTTSSKSSLTHKGIGVPQKRLRCIPSTKNPPRVTPRPYSPPLFLPPYRNSPVPSVFQPVMKAAFFDGVRDPVGGFVVGDQPFFDVFYFDKPRVHSLAQKRRVRSMSHFEVNKETKISGHTEAHRQQKPVTCFTVPARNMRPRAVSSAMIALSASLTYCPWYSVTGAVNLPLS
jgi:hypothetical protein